MVRLPEHGQKLEKKKLTIPKFLAKTDYWNVSKPISEQKRGVF